MGKTLQKAGIGIAIGGLALACLGAVLVQAGPRHLELLFAGVHTTGKAVTGAGLVLFLIVRVLGRHSARIQRLTWIRATSLSSFRSAALRAALAGAVVASFFAIWMWPLRIIFPGNLPGRILAFGHLVGLAVFMVAGVSFVIASAFKTLATPMPPLPVQSPFASPGPPPSDAAIR